MSTYAVGDVQGCHRELMALLERIKFDPPRDRLILVGDLVNRGPDSLAVLRTIRALGAAAICLLGNHDLHLLAVAAGGRPGRRDTLHDVLRAPDRDELIAWLHQRPLAWYEPGHRMLFVHAGLAPEWHSCEALALAEEASSCLRGADAAHLLRHMYGDLPDRWGPELSGIERVRFIINCMTRIRYCRADGRIELRTKGTPGSQTGHLRPWFQMPRRASRDVRVVFGHWSTLGQVHWPHDGVYGLDTGCVWGGRLTCLRLDDATLHSVPGHVLAAPAG